MPRERKGPVTVAAVPSPNSQHIPEEETPMNVRTDSTRSPAEPAEPTKQQVWDALFALETAITNARDAALALDTVFEDSLKGNGDDGVAKTIKERAGFQDYKIFVLTDHQLCSLHYMRLHVGDLIHTLHNEFFRVTGGRP
jgi:hypothetical protein